MSVGGASDSDASDVAVQPARASPSPQAMIATPEEKRPHRVSKGGAVGVAQAPVAHARASMATIAHPQWTPARDSRLAKA